MKLIILAAGQGKRLRPLTNQRPKCLVPLAGKPILDHLFDTAAQVGFSEIVLIGGYRADALANYPAQLEYNPRYSETNMVRSLFCAEAHFGEGFVLSYSDICYRPEILRDLRDTSADISVVVDEDWRTYWERRGENPLDDAETLLIENGQIVEIGGKTQTFADIDAQYIGLMAFRSRGVNELRQAYASARAEERNGRLNFGRSKSVDSMYLTDLLQGMIDRGSTLTPLKIHGGWVEIDTPTDLVLAEALLSEGRFGVQE